MARLRGLDALADLGEKAGVTPRHWIGGNGSTALFRAATATVGRVAHRLQLVSVVSRRRLHVVPNLVHHEQGARRPRASHLLPIAVALAILVQLLLILSLEGCRVARLRILEVLAWRGFNLGLARRTGRVLHLQTATLQ